MLRHPRRVRPAGRRGDARRRRCGCGPTGWSSFGLGGPEIGVPRPQFAPHFEQARAAGLHSVPHAGESTGPQTHLGRDRPPGRRADRPRHLGGAGPGPHGLSGRARHPARDLPDVERLHAVGAVAGRAPAADAGRGRRAGLDQLRRPADVRHDAEREYEVAPRAARPRRRRRGRPGPRRGAPQSSRPTRSRPRSSPRSTPTLRLRTTHADRRPCLDARPARAVSWKTSLDHRRLGDHEQQEHA